MKAGAIHIPGAIAVLLLSATAGAEPYREAHQLVLRAEAMFQLHRIDDALDLLGQVLVRQKRQGKPYGYARYVYFRRALHLMGKGDRQRARAELLRALKITDGQQRVVRQFRVTRHHPFIVKHFPRLAGFAWQRYPERAVAPASWLVNAAGRRFVYAVGRHAAFRLDRRAGTKLKLQEETRGEIVAFAATADHRRFASVIKQGKRHTLRFLQLDPFEESVAPVPGAPLALAMASRDKAALLFTRHNRLLLRVFRIEADQRRASVRRRPQKPLLAVRAALLHGSDRAMVYAAYDRKRSFDPQRAPRYKAVFFSKLDRSSKPVLLYRFPVVDHRNRIFVTVGDSGRTFALFVGDAARKERRVVIFDAQTGRRRVHRNKILIAHDEPAARFSHDEDYLVLLQRLSGKLRVFRMDLLSGATKTLATVDAPTTLRVYGFGVMKGNERIWLHLAGDLVILDPKARKQLRARLPGSRTKNAASVGWTGRDHYLLDPEQWFIGIQRADQPTFMALPPKKLSFR